MQELAKHYYLVYINATDTEELNTAALLSRFDVTTLPHLVVINPAGVETLRLGDYATRADLLEKLRVSVPGQP